MSTRYVQANATKGVNALRATTDEANERIESWKTMTNAELVTHKDEMERNLHMIEAKLLAVDKHMQAFNKEADKINEDDDEGQKKIDDYIMTVVDTIDEANDAKDRISILIKKMEGKDTSSSNTETTPVAVQIPVISQFKGQYDIPKIPKFSGKSWEFENFWTLFEELVHKTTQSELLKFNHLINCLDGEAKELIKKFKVNKDNYHLAVELLKKKFNNEEKIIAELTNQLRQDTPKNNSLEEQRKTLDKIVITLAQLKEHGETVDCQLTKMQIIDKFTDNIRKQVFRKKMDVPRKEWTVDKIIEELDNIITREEELKESMKKDKQPDKSNEKPADKKSPKESNSKKPEMKCIFCKEEGHRGSGCKTFSTLKQREEIFLKEKRCYQCARTGHSKTECTNKPCFKCEGKHHISLCQKDTKNESSTKKTNESPQGEKNKQKPKTQAVAHTFQTDMGTPAPEERVTNSSDDKSTERQTATTVSKKKISAAFIPTVRVKALNPSNNRWEHISMMLDSGADQTYVTEALANSWKLKTNGQETFHLRTFGAPEAQIITFDRTQISIVMGSETIDLNVYVSGHLTGRITKAELSPEDLHFALREKLNINADSLENMVQPDIIIGCDYMSRIISGKIIHLPSGLDLIETAEGFTTFGRQDNEQLVSKEKDTEEKFQFMSMKDQKEDLALQIEEDQRRDTTMKLPDENSGPVEEEQEERNRQTMEFFKRTVEKREDGYYVRIPYKKNHPTVPDNFVIAFKRLQSVYKNSSQEVLGMVDDVFTDQLQKGIIEEVDQSERTNQRIHYNPTQPVLTPHKTTTKCRVVVDGSSHFKGELSLNDIIEPGGVLIPDMIDMLIRFRSGFIAIIADVEKAFLQVHLHHDDRDVTRVLWLKDISKPPTRDNIVVYRFTRVLFGFNVSPFLLGATILHHLEQHEDQVFAKDVAINLFVDNLVLTTDQEPERAIAIYENCKKTFNEISMNLRGFLTNSDTFNNLVKEDDREKDQIIKVLGIQWSSVEDTLNMATNIQLLDTNSRRTVSSIISGIFDPLGFLVPIMLELKLFQRELWDDRYKWDTHLTNVHESQWRSLVDKANHFSIDIPRNVIHKTGPNTIITFTDASAEATACCVYIKNANGTNILFGKSKVRPLKEKWTIPKLETQALKMGVDRTNMVLKALTEGRIEVTNVIVMTDSQIALDWLKAAPGRKEVGVFISNRLNAIRKSVWEMEEYTSVHFGHVRTEDNPADLGTRGISQDKFKDTIWWNGPKFLQKDQTEWDIKTFSITDQGTIQMNLAKCDRTREAEFIFDCSRIENYFKMIRVAATTMKFIKKSSKRLPENTKKMMNIKFDIWNTDVEISAAELREAEIILLRDQQKAIDEKKMKELVNLGLTINKDKLIVCKGRMELAELDEDTKFPILLLPNTDIGKMIIRNCHGKFHNSLQHTMDAVRRKFWMPRLRQQTKTLIRTCVPCQRVNKQPSRYPDMARLPTQRVTRSRPFANIGLDYFGPIQYRNEDGTEASAYGAIFTCSTTRLTHIEIALDNSAFQFLQCLRRFIAIRGLPEKIVSDNGTNFTLGQKIVEEAMNHPDSSDTQKIEWKFITPYSPGKAGYMREW